MPNLGYSQGTWTDFFREFLQYMRLVRLTAEFGRRFREGRIRVYETYDNNNFLSAWTFSGAKRGVNTSEDGRLYITLTDETPGAGQARTQVYMDSAKTQLVAQGDAADGATATLAAQNNSGLTGTVKLGTVTATDSDIVLFLDIDEMQKGARAFDLSTIGGVNAYKSYNALLESIGVALSSQASNARTNFESKYIGVKLKEFLKSSQSTVIRVTEETDENGDTVITKEGLLAELDDDMADNGTAQTIEKNTVTGLAGGALAAVFDPDNVGVGTLSFIAAREHAPSGTVTLKCTAGKDDTLSETFGVELLVKKTNQVIKGKLDLVIKKEWESQLIGHRLKLNRTIVDAFDGGSQVSTYVINGETLDNTDFGILYLELLAGSFPGGNNRRINLYKDSAKQSLVARGDRIGDGTVTLAEQNGSGLTGSCVIVYASDDLDIQVNLQAFKEGDIITFEVENDYKGIIQTMFAEYFGISLNSTTPGAATLKDELIKESFDHLAAVS
jgi:hypothetical protein